MSMSKIYALITVAEFAIRASCAKAERGKNPSTSAHHRLLSVIQLVSSWANLIAELWHIPDAKRDGRKAVSSFESRNGARNISRLQHLAIEHILKVQDVFSMADADINDMDNRAMDRNRRAQISKDHSATLTSIKQVDKPNVHRLLELFQTTSSMVGSIARIGD